MVFLIFSIETLFPGESCPCWESISRTMIIYKFTWDPNNLPENVDARQDTTAVDIFRRCNKDMLNPMLTTINRRGSNGAPSHPVVIQKRIIQIKIIINDYTSNTQVPKIRKTIPATYSYLCYYS